MKIRTGFVSNSSSSSFVLWHKQNMTEQQLINYLQKTKLFETKQQHALHKEIDNICKYIVTNIDNRFYNYQEYIDDMWYSQQDEQAKELFDNGFICTQGSVSDDEYGDTQRILSIMTFDYKDENIYLIKDESR